MKKYSPVILIFAVILTVIASTVWFFDKNSPTNKLLAGLNLSKQETSFLKQEGFLENLEQNLPLKSPTLIEQNINTEDEGFEVLATKLDKDSYQLAFKLENKKEQL